MDQAIQYKILNAKSEIAEILGREDEWMGGRRDRVHFGLVTAATVITFIVSLGGADSIGGATLSAVIAFSGSFMLVGAVLMSVDDSFSIEDVRADLIEGRKALVESTLDARVHEGQAISSGAWNEFTIERDDTFEKVMVRIVECGEIETVELKDSVVA